jgi:cellulose synthase/poly-beta-1,6-N-acetylglucosamine synthase-like glycosyltransferase
MIQALNIILLLLGALFVYAWFGYPAVLGLLAKRAERRNAPAAPSAVESCPRTKDSPLPHVYIILAAFNEESVIAERIRNLQRVDYPSERLSVLVGADGCTDGTAEAARTAAHGDSRIQILEFPNNRGKVAVLQDLVARSRRQPTSPDSAAPLLIFSDANTMFAEDAVLKLVVHFNDPQIGGVCGRLIFTHASATEAVNGETIAENPAEEGLYWHLETKLKTWESALDSCLGANGAIYAIRPELFWEAIPANTIVDDFVIGMKVREQGSRMVYDPAAVATEQLPELSDERERRIRIGSGDYQALGFCKACLSPRFGWFAWAFWSHKALRWFMPHLAIVVAGICYPMAVIAYATGAGIIDILPAAAGAILLTSLFAAGRAGRHLSSRGYGGRVVRLCGACDHFVTMHVALFLGFIRFCTGNMTGTWKRTPRTRRSGNPV